MHSVAKGLAKAALGGPGAARLIRAVRRGRALVLAYHNLVADDITPEGDRSLHLRVSEFTAQLEWLLERFEVVPLSRALNTSPGAPPRVCITFDDAYEGALSLGIRELERLGLPATIFVSAGCVGDDGFWWDELAGELGLEARVRARALTELAGDRRRIREWAEESGQPIRPAPPYARPAGIAELEAAAESPLIEFGSHGWSHSNLTRVSSDRLTSELARSRRWLEDRFRSFSPLLTYPYGLVDRDVAQAAEACGYSAAFRIAGGWLPRRISDRFTLPRANVPGTVTLAEFELRVWGLGRA